MDINEKTSQLLDLIDNGQCDYEHLGQLTYENLYALYITSVNMKNGSDIYRKIKNLIDSTNVNSIKNKGMTIAILPTSASTWFADRIVDMFLGIDMINFFILPCMTWLNDSMREEEYVDCLNLLSKRYPDHTKGTYCFEENRQYSWSELNIDPDLIIWTNPYPLTRDCYEVTNIPLNKIMCYVQYGINTADNTERTFHPHAHYSMPFFNLMWKIFVATYGEIEESKKYSFVKGNNLVYSGYPKMDVFFENRNVDVNSIWKRPKNANDDYLRVIYCPHHSLKGTNMLAWSTFEENGDFMYKLAQNHPEISWIIRPHPQLGERLVQKNVMSMECYKQYLNKWEELPNAKVSEYEEYFDIFLTSSAMIQDCASFLAEYLYVNKPMCFLMGEETTFNPLGEKCASVAMKVDARDYDGITKFVESLSEPEDQEVSEKRNKLFEEELNYYNRNKMSASEFIFCYILAQIYGDLL